MTPLLKISETFMNRLSTCGENENRSGKLYGILAKDSLFILGIEIDLDGTTNNDLTNTFPAEVDICGRINFGSGSYNEQTIKKNLSDIDVTDNPVFLYYNTSSNNLTANYFINNKLENVKFKIVTENDILSEFLHIRLQGSLPFRSELTHDAIEDTFLKLRKSVASGAMAFNFNKTDIYLLGSTNEDSIIGVSPDTKINDLQKDSNNSSEGSKRKKKTTTATAELEIFDVNMLKRVTDIEGEEATEHAPICLLEKKKAQMIIFNAKIDAITMLHKQLKFGRLYDILVESAIRSLKLLEKSLLNSLKNTEKDITPIETYHFYPRECGHFVTLIYPKNDKDSDLVDVRKRLHHTFLLPFKSPIFRKGNCHNFDESFKKLLTNPHEGLKPTDNGGKISLVKGKYLYYHYGQNNMDDKGWGCAYRSLQTLASWFKLQGYTDRNVPNFEEIQKCLVDIGDKGSNFIGSRQWIGSTEVNYVLDTLLGVTSKILFVSTGEDMGSKGQELLNHFETHGSPIMIGGGVLAHTILGVDYNLESGSLKFLILDPHYTGAEDLHTIQSKGWCGWKGVEFWDKTAYYNMCLPQVPVGI